MNKPPTPDFLVVCYNDRGFCRSMHFDTEYEARNWADANVGNYAKLTIEKNVGGEWAPARKRFVIVAWPRTGSTHLAHQLNNHDEILCHGEIFQTQITGLPVRWPDVDKKMGVIAELSNLRSTDPRAFLDRIWSRDYDCEFVGFKIFPGHNNEMLAEIVSDSTIRKIVLLRRNILAAYSSALIARLTDDRRREAAALNSGWRPTVEFEPDQFMKFAAIYRDFYHGVFEKLQETRQPLHLHLYEDINNRGQIDRLIRFIGARPVERLISTLRKQNSGDILSRFSNPTDLSRFLEAHDLDWGNEAEAADDA